MQYLSHSGSNLRSYFKRPFSSSSVPLENKWFSSVYLGFIKLEEKSVITTFFSRVCIGVYVCQGASCVVHPNTRDVQELVLRLLSRWVSGLPPSPSSVLLQGVYAGLPLAHILLRRISEQTWLIGPLTWYGDWKFVTESCCCCSLLWLLKYFPTIWFLDCFILIKWYSLVNFDFTTCK